MHHDSQKLPNVQKVLQNGIHSRISVFTFVADSGVRENHSITFFDLVVFETTFIMVSESNIVSKTYLSFAFMGREKYRL